MKITNKTNLMYPVRDLNQEEANLISILMKFKLSISWNGENLHYKRLVESETLNLSFMTANFKASDIRTLLELKYLYPHIVELPNGDKKHLISVNPFYKRYVENAKNPDFSKFSLISKVGEVTIPVSIYSPINLDIPYYYRETLTFLEEFPEVSLKDFKKTLYLSLMYLGFLYPYIFKVGNIFVIFHKGEIVKIDEKFFKTNRKKDKVEKELEKESKEETVEVEEKQPVQKEKIELVENNTEHSELSKDSSINITKDGNYSFKVTVGNQTIPVKYEEELNTSFVRTMINTMYTMEEISEKSKETLTEDMKKLQKLIYQNNNTYRKVSLYSKRSYTTSEEKEKLISILNSYVKNSSEIKTFKTNIERIIESYKSLEREGRVKSLKKLNTKYTKPLSKLNIPDDASEGLFIAKTFDYIFKNRELYLTKEELANKIKQDFEKSSLALETVVPYDSKNLSMTFIKYFLPSYKGTFEDFSFFLGTPKSNVVEGINLSEAMKKYSTDFTDGVLIAVEKNNKSGSWKTLMTYVPSKSTKELIMDNKEKVNDFHKVSFYNINAIGYREFLENFVYDLEFFTEEEKKHVNWAVRMVDYYSVPKAGKGINLHLHNSADNNKKLALQKLYNVLHDYFQIQLRKEMSQKIKSESSSYARPFETKKHIHKYIVEAMEDNAFKNVGENFKFVEIDNDVDLEVFKKVEDEYTELINGNILPPLLSKNTLRFRKLGNLKAGEGRSVAGVYFRDFKTICIDISNEDSFIHEYGHAIDYDYSINNKPLSSYQEFDYIAKTYTEKLKEYFSGRDYTYFSMREEIFARAFELYISKKELKSKRLQTSYSRLSSNPEYLALQGLDSEIIEYFESIFNI